MAVLRAAGNLKRKFPDDDEFVLMLRSIIDVNLCKFLSHDVPLFNGIVSDLFPGITLPTPDYDALTVAMKAQCAQRNLQPTEYFLMKTVQLYEMIVVRHGLMTVGQPFSGKSSSLQVLAGALTDLHDQGVAGTLFNRIQVSCSAAGVTTTTPENTALLAFTVLAGHHAALLSSSLNAQPFVLLKSTAAYSDLCPTLPPRRHLTKKHPPPSPGAAASACRFAASIPSR
eukprot:358972-Chlamydomonas_euryale.AAC.5